MFQPKHLKMEKFTDMIRVKDVLNMMEINVHLNNPSTTNGGKFQGWGTSLCWWANRLGYSSTLTQKSAKLFFSKEGLNLNIMRYNIGGGDDPEHKHITRTDSIVPGWLRYNKATDEYTYNYSADINQLNVLKACYEANENSYVEVFSNSPPYFMTKSGCSSGGKNPNENNLRDDCYEAFAEYLAHVTQYINNNLKIKVNSISPMNEPNTDFWHYLSEKQEGCHFDSGESQNKIILETAKAIKNKGLCNIEIVGSDETSTDKAILTYNEYSDDVKNVLNRISTHSYGSERIKELGELMKKEDRNLWMSETDGGNVSGENAGEMGAGLWLSKKIISDINALSPSAWVLWLVIDFHKSKEGYCGNKDFGIPDKEKGFWGLAFVDHDTEEILLTQKYYCMGQFSRYINVDDTIQHINEDVLCATNEKEVKLVVVNDKTAPTPLKIDLNDTNRCISSVKAIRTSGNLQNGESWYELPEEIINDNIYEITLKGNSITTFIFR